MSDRTYRYFVKPLNDSANEALAEMLNAQGSAAGTLEQQSILVDGKPVSGVYEVLHPVITKLQHSDFHRKNVRVYVQEGLGLVRPYVHYQTVVKRLARTKPVSKVKQQIAGLRKG
jgi:hypothetical protein